MYVDLVYEVTIYVSVFWLSNFCNILVKINSFLWSESSSIVLFISKTERVLLGKIDLVNPLSFILNLRTMYMVLTNSILEVPKGNLIPFEKNIQPCIWHCGESFAIRDSLLLWDRLYG